MRKMNGAKLGLVMIFVTQLLVFFCLSHTFADFSILTTRISINMVHINSRKYHQAPCAYTVSQKSYF